MLVGQFYWTKCLLLLASGLVYVVPSGATASEEDVRRRGRQLVVEHGCLGCHKIGSRGGNLGPDITYAGDKAVRDLDFTRVEGERTVANWMFAYFKSPTTVLPGAMKPDLGLSDEEARALADYMVRLKRSAASPAPIPLPRPVKEASPESQALYSKALYSTFCSACHGCDGQGGTVRAAGDSRPAYRPEESIASALGNPDMLGVASDDYLRMIIRSGRSGTSMQAWAKEGGLSEDEIEQLIAHLRSWEEATSAKMESISASRGNSRHGQALYRSRCTACHGYDGLTSTGLSLHSTSLLTVASDDFLARAIVHGRANTAMPSWKRLSAAEVSDLLAYLRAWEPDPPSKPAVLTGLSRSVRDGSSEATGREVYRSNCAICHGEDGEGALGPSLNKDAFLSVVDNEYLYTAIVAGRPGTAMAAWKQLPVGDLVHLINFLRSRNERRRHRLQPYQARGDRDRGSLLFQKTCAGCHGRHAEGAAGPQLNNRIFLGSVTDAMLREWIRHRCPVTQGESVSQGEQKTLEFSEAQIADVVTHLRHIPGGQRVARAGHTMGSAEDGADIVTFVCTTCHGPAGEGLTASALSNPDFLRSASDGFLLASIVMGRERTRMLPMVGKSEGALPLSADDLRDMVAFLRWEHDPPASGIPARYVTDADPNAGKELYAGICAGCHGPHGNDGWAVTLNNPDFLAAATDGFLQATLTRGRASTAMRPVAVGADGTAELSLEEINHIVAYVRSWAAPENRPAE